MIKYRTHDIYNYGNCSDRVDGVILILNDVG